MCTLEQKRLIEKHHCYISCFKQADLWPATNSVPAPLYRGYCHIKVFRDKGAERKHKDEQKTAEKRLMKYAREAESMQKEIRLIL